MTNKTELSSMISDLKVETGQAVFYLAMAILLGAPGAASTAAATVAFTFPDFMAFSEPTQLLLTVLGPIGILLGLASLIRGLRYKNRVTRRWAEFFAGWELLTPAGEKVTCVASSFWGTELTVKFADGWEWTYPVNLLCDGKGRPYAFAGRMMTSDEWMHQRMAATRWKTPEGRIGVVRSARSRYEANAEIDLKLDDGTVKSFEIPSLEPVSDRAVA